MSTAEKLDMFEKSVGKHFGLAIPQGTLTDEITGVDRKYEHVCGKLYGNFHVDLVELIFKCPRCGMISFNPHDAENSYCGNCHIFF